jgi:hypothetical protein
MTTSTIPTETKRKEIVRHTTLVHIQWDRPERREPQVLAITPARRRVPGWVHMGGWRLLVCDRRTKRRISVWRKRRDWRLTAD